MKKLIKKLLIFVFATIFLSSCVSDMGESDRYWIVDMVKSSSIRNSKNATYTILSFDKDGYKYQGFKFEDVQGKFKVGDTVTLIKVKY